MNSRISKAIASCARTLTGAPDVETMIARANAATVGGLRAYADRFTLQRRFHDPALHAAHLPSIAAAAWLFDALEQARLDALGARWMPGMAANLTAHPGADDDGPRWLAFAAFSARAVPSSKTTFVAASKKALPAPMLDELTRLTTHLDDQRAFAAAAAAWANRAVALLPPAQTADPGTRRLALPIRMVERWERKGRFVAASAASRRDRTVSTGDEVGAGSGLDRQRSSLDGPDAGYRVYTTAHDRVITASALATRQELEELRGTLDLELGTVRSVVSRLAKRLLRVLMARQVREWRFDLDEGLLDASRLAPMIASRGAARPFKEETDSPFPSTVVTLLIDHSGSMRGRPMRIAALTVEIFVRVLERCGVKCEVLGFTTRDWDGGEPGREWAANGYPENPGRLNALEHIVIKSADVPWRRARVGLGLCLRDEMLKENIDGEALIWAHRRLLARSEQRRILIVVSDGTPMDEATLAANGFDYLDHHLLTVVQDIESRSPVQLAAIGIGHDVSQFYTNATRIAKVEDLGPALSARLIALLS